MYNVFRYTICNELEWFFPKEMCEYKILSIVYRPINVEKIQFFSDYYNMNSENHVHFHITINASDPHCNFIEGKSCGYATFHYYSFVEQVSKLFKTRAVV